jgi:hypothetical protein
MSSRVTPADDLIGAQPVLHASTDFSSSPDLDLDDKKKHSDDQLRSKSETSSLYDVKSAQPLAPAGTVTRSAGRAILEGLGLKKRSKDEDLDAIATQESVFDGPTGSLYRPFASFPLLSPFLPLP